MSNNENSYKDPLCKSDRARSNYVRELVKNCNKRPPTISTNLPLPPKRIVQFWDQLDTLPLDVSECMKSWNKLEKLGFELEIFDEKSTRKFIQINLGSRYEKAFDKCYHPSMKSDYFRYSYIYVKGGFYIDADDVYHGKSIDSLFTDGRLKLQPFCYDISTAQMVPPSIFVNSEADNLNWIFYFNTTPMIAGPGHPIIERALLNATIALEQETLGTLPEVQATTGPGNLTKSIFEVMTEGTCAKETLMIAYDWEETSTSKWPLSYRNDKRNWRLSNQQNYSHQRGGEEL